MGHKTLTFSFNAVDFSCKFLSSRCDIYSQRSVSEQTQLTEGFLKFLEAINKIRRPVPNRMPKVIILYFFKTLIGGTFVENMPHEMKDMEKFETGL